MNLICYLSNGYRTIEESKKLAKVYSDAGCDIIELDFPSRDPYLEGDFIKSRMAEALEVCDDYDQYMQAFIDIKAENPNQTLFVLAYENTVLEIGKEKFTDFCVNNGFFDVIYVGLQNEDTKNYLLSRGLKISCYVQFHMMQEEIESAKNSNGFVYMQAKPTSGNINAKFPTLKDCIAELRRQGIDRDIFCGVGVATSEDYKMVEEAGGDGAFVGSTILKLFDNVPELTKTIRAFKNNF